MSTWQLPLHDWAAGIVPLNIHTDGATGGMGGGGAFAPQSLALPPNCYDFVVQKKTTKNKYFN